MRFYQPENYWISLEHTFNDMMSSFKNHTNWNVAFAYHVEGGGHCFTASPWQEDPAFWSKDNDQVSSLLIGRVC